MRECGTKAGPEEPNPSQNKNKPAPEKKLLEALSARSWRRFSENKTEESASRNGALRSSWIRAKACSGPRAAAQGAPGPPWAASEPAPASEGGALGPRQGMRGLGELKVFKGRKQGLPLAWNGKERRQADGGHGGRGQGAQRGDGHNSPRSLHGVLGADLRSYGGPEGAFPARHPRRISKGAQRIPARRIGHGCEDEGLGDVLAARMLPGDLLLGQCKRAHLRGGAGEERSAPLGLGGQPAKKGALPRSHGRGALGGCGDGLVPLGRLHRLNVDDGIGARARAWIGGPEEAEASKVGGPSQQPRRAGGAEAGEQDAQEGRRGERED